MWAFLFCILLITALFVPALGMALIMLAKLAAEYWWIVAPILVFWLLRPAKGWWPRPRARGSVARRSPGSLPR